MSLSSRLQQTSRWCAYGIAALIFVLAPMQLAMPCGSCDMLLGFAGSLFLLAVVLCILGTHTAKNRFLPAALAFAALLAHTFFVHL
jgi:hypothetical protein